MFGFRKKENKPLWIRAKDVFAIIRSDYADGIAFCLIDFNCNGQSYTMGSVLRPNQEEQQENIYFVFQEEYYDTYDAFADSVQIDGVKLSDADMPIEIVRAGIIDGQAMITSPWGDTRLAAHAVKN